MAKASHGINPVTFRPTHPSYQGDVQFTLGRMHVGVAGHLQKLVTAVMFRKTDATDRDKVDAVLGHVVLDEGHFARGLHHLFPDGSQDHVGDDLEFGGERQPIAVPSLAVYIDRQTPEDKPYFVDGPGDGSGVRFATPAEAAYVQAWLEKS